MTSVTIQGNGLQVIGQSCFACCDLLAEIQLPPSVVKIGGDAFRGCRSLGTFTLPPKLTTIGYDTFRGCRNLRITGYPSGLTSIDKDAFSSTGITDALLPAGMTSIGIGAFSGCTNLVSARIPSGVAAISSSAFSGCDKLEDLVIEEGVEIISNYTFSGCVSLRKLVLPTTLKSVGRDAFANCNFDSLVLPASLVSISDAFLECTNLSSVTVLSTTLTGAIESTGDLIFANKDSDLVNLAKHCRGKRIFLTGGIESIPASTFENTECAEIVLDENVTEIGDYAFRGCTASTIVIKGAVRLGKGVFQDCGKLRRVVVSDGIAEFPDDTFSGCSSLEELNWPMQLSAIGDEAFYGCALTNLDLSQTCVSTIGKQAFYWCRSLWKPAVLPATLTFIDDQAFGFTQMAYDPEFGTAPTQALVKFLGAPPAVGEDVFDFLIYTCNSSQWGAYTEDFACEWCAAIAEWSRERGVTCQWADLNFKMVVDAFSAGWKISENCQELNVGWHLPTNDNYMIEQAAKDLQDLNLEFAIWRSSMNPDDAYDDWSRATNIVKHYRGDAAGGTFSNYLDKAFGSIKGTAPVKYWVEIENPTDRDNLKCITDLSKFDYRQLAYGRIPPSEEPSASFVTRRRFALAVGLSQYSLSIFPADDKGEMCFPPDEWLPSLVKDTTTFIDMLKAQKADVRSLINERPLWQMLVNPFEICRMMLRGNCDLLQETSQCCGWRHTESTEAE